MLDPRLAKLAEVIVHHSTRIEPGENVLIEAVDCDHTLLNEIVAQVHAAGGHAYVNLRDSQVLRQLLLQATKEQLSQWAEVDAKQMNMMQAYIAIRGNLNVNELSDVPSDQLALYNQLYIKPVHIEIRTRQTKWLILRYPHSSMAQMANMSTHAFEDFFFTVCTMDYRKMGEAMGKLVNLMHQTNRVRILGPGTDLAFSIKDIPVIPCAGEFNLPDGEVYTAPVKDSVNGTITFNTPTPYNGYVYEQVHLQFEGGRVVEATANDSNRLQTILDTDQGSRFLGEFAIGVHPYIHEPMKDILFDEKINGSIHLALGNSYDNAYNGNHSAIHWDLVLIQRPEYGGGEIWFDDRLIRKDGIFVVPELEPLNPENLR